MKDKDGPLAFFADVLASDVNSLKLRPTYSTCVPPEPSQNRIRFAATLTLTTSYP